MDSDYASARAVLETLMIGIGNQVSPEWSAGTRVQCNWKVNGTYYPGVIASRDGEKVSINYDDRDKEQTTVSLCRLSEAAAAPTASSTPKRASD